MSETDDELVEAYLAGDYKAFETLFNRYKSRLFPYLIGLSADKQEAEDVFQETFIKVINKLSDYKKENKFSAWIFLIAKNTFLDRRKNKKNSFFGNSVSMDCVDGDFSLSEIIPSGENPQKEAVLKEDIEKVNKALSALSFEQKEVILLKNHGDFSFKEIAEILKVPIGTALARFSRGMAKLKEILEKMQ